MYSFDKQIDFLLKNACPSIRYLVKRDMLKIPVNEPEMSKLQEEILLQSNARKILSHQHEDGWLGEGIHGIESMDCHIGGLLGLGVEPDSLCIHKAIKALTDPQINKNHRMIFLGGEALDAGGRGGNHAIIAQILSWVGFSEDYPIMAEQIEFAQKNLFAVFDYSSPDDFSVKMKNYRCYKPNALFPGDNHIRLLNATKRWRTSDKEKKARDAVKHCYEMMKDFSEYITFRKPKEYGNGVVGPFNFNWQALNPFSKEDIRGIMESSYNYQFAFWLRGINLPEWIRQSTDTYEVLAQMITEDEYMEMIPKPALKAMRAVSGREPCWRNKNSVKCDVMFEMLNACYSVLND